MNPKPTTSSEYVRYIGDSWAGCWLDQSLTPERGVLFYPMYMQMSGGNANDALILAQIVYWHGLDSKGKPRLTHWDGKHLWLVKQHQDWQQETGVKAETARKCIDRLVERNLVIKDVRLSRMYKNVNGTLQTACHLRLNWSVFISEVRAWEKWQEALKNMNGSGESHPIVTQETVNYPVAGTCQNTISGTVQGPDPLYTESIDTQSTKRFLNFEAKFRALNLNELHPEPLVNEAIQRAIMIRIPKFGNWDDDQVDFNPVISYNGQLIPLMVPLPFALQTLKEICDYLYDLKMAEWDYLTTQLSLIEGTYLTSQEDIEFKGNFKRIISTNAGFSSKATTGEDEPDQKQQFDFWIRYAFYDYHLDCIYRQHPTEFGYDLDQWSADALGDITEQVTGMTVDEFWLRIKLKNLYDYSLWSTMLQDYEVYDPVFIRIYNQAHNDDLYVPVLLHYKTYMSPEMKTKYPLKGEVCPN